MRVRRVKTASGATAVQLVEYRHGRRQVIEHLGSAHDEAELAVLEQMAREKIHAGHPILDLDLPEGDAVPAGGAGPVVSGLRLSGTRASLLWQVLQEAYARIGFGEAVADEVFAQLVLARVIEPVSKADTPRVLRSLGIDPTPSYATIKRRLRQCVDEDWRDALCQAAYDYVAGRAGGAVSVVLYDVTTLYFEADEEDEFRKTGFSKERRVDPQILVGLLVDTAGFPLEIHSFAGNKAETTTIIPVLDAFKARHRVEEMLVVADAGMLSWANLQALEEAGYRYIVGTRTSKAPYDLADTLARGNHFADGQVFETTTMVKRNVTGSQRRAVWQYRLAREHRDRRNHTLQVQRAEDIAAGRKQPRKARFLTGGGAKSLEVDYDAAKAAERLFGLKGYVTNVPMTVLDGTAVIAAYHALFEVEASFRMAKSDLKARPIFAYTKDSIEAHLTIVFAALAVSRELQQRTGLSIKKILNTLAPIRDGIAEINGTQIVIPAQISTPARDLLASLPNGPH